MIRVFYNDSALDQGIESNEAIEMGFDQSKNIFYNLSEEQGSFIGFKDINNKIIQFGWFKENIWLIDIPQSAKQGSYQKYCEFDDCLLFVKHFYDNDIETLITDLTFNEW